MNVNFHDKNFVIATLFCDYCRIVAPTRTIDVVAPLTILTRGIEMKLEIIMTHFKFQSCVRGFQSVWMLFIGETQETSNLHA